jgi:hypothetical protein
MTRLCKICGWPITRGATGGCHSGGQATCLVCQAARSLADFHYPPETHPVKRTWNADEQKAYGQRWRARRKLAILWGTLR